MKNLEILAWIKSYYTSRRGVGHTFAMIHGARDQDNCIVVAHDHKYASDLKRQLHGHTVIALSDIPQALHGKNDPLVLDHWALVALIDGIFKDIARLQEEMYRLAVENRDLKEQRDLNE